MTDLILPALGGIALVLPYYMYLNYKHLSQSKKLNNDINTLMDRVDTLIETKNKLESEIYRLKQNKSDDLRAFIHDMTIDSGLVSITRINPEDIFIHNRDKR
jgi:hypothetical protein